MSYTDEQLVLDRQTLIYIAEKDRHIRCTKHFDGAVICNRIFMWNKCAFEFTKSVVWDDGEMFIKLKDPHLVKLIANHTFKLPDQTPFQHSVITFEPDIFNLSDRPTIL